MSLDKSRKDGSDTQEMIRTWRLQQRALGLRAKGTLFSAKGIGFRCKGHLGFVQRARRSLQRAPLSGETGASAAASLLKMSEAEHCQPQHVFCETKELQETRNRNIPQKCAQRRVRRCLFQIRNWQFGRRRRGNGNGWYLLGARNEQSFI